MKEKLKVVKCIRRILKIQTVRFRPFEVKCDEQDIISALQGAFEGKNYSYSALYWKQKPDVYFPKYKLGIEVDEYDHPYRDPNYEQSRQLRIEGHGITVIRTNPEAPNCINKLINQIYMHIIESTKKQTEKSTIKRIDWWYFKKIARIRI